MIKLTLWPGEEGAECLEFYVNPHHIIALVPQGKGTVLSLLGHPPERVKENIETVLRRMQNPGEWMH